MSASICLSFSHELFEQRSREEAGASLPAWMVAKHEAAMREAYEILCPELTHRSPVEEILASVREQKRRA